MYFETILANQSPLALFTPASPPEWHPRSQRDSSPRWFGGSEWQL